MIRIEFTPVEHKGMRFTQVSLHADPDDVKDMEGASAYLMARTVHSMLTTSSPVSVEVPNDASEEGLDYLRDDLVKRANSLSAKLGIDLNGGSKHVE